MADNAVLSAAVGTGITVALDDIGGVMYPRSKVSLGADGTAVDAAAGAGVVGTDTQRVTLGSDDPAVVALQLIDNAISGAGFNITQLAGASVPIGAGVEATAVRVTLATDSTGVVSIDDNGGSVTVDAPVGTPVFVRLSDGSSAITTLPVSIAAGATAIGKAEDVASADADVGVPSMAVRKATPSNTSGTDGDYEFLQMSAGRLWVSAAVDTALPAGTNAIGKLAANTGVTIGAVEIASSQTLATVTTVTTVSTLTGSAIAHDSADSGNPHKIGAKATTSLSGGTNVADADRTDIKASVDGAAYVRDIALEDIVTGTPVVITDGSSTSVLSAQGAGIKIYITDVIISNSSTTGVTVDLRDGTAGSVKATIPVPAAGASNVGGVVKSFRTPLPFSANPAVAADPSAAASSITVTLIGFKSKV